jgi:polyhydroxybutyrate depolymerase
MRRFLLILLTVLSAASLSAQGKIRELLAAKPPEGCVERAWDVGGVKRTAVVRAPLTKGEARPPVVFGWHGHYGTAARVAGSWDIMKLWPEAVFVFPQGLPTATINDPSGKGNGWQTKQGAQEDRDLKFFDAMLADVLKDFDADAGRVYSLGHSNGGVFTYLLWQTRADKFAAIAPVAGVITSRLKDAPAMPVLHVAGRKDAIVKFAGQQTSIAAARKANGCVEESKPWAQAGELKGEIWTSDKAPVVAVIHEGGHEFPKDASELIVRFFKENPKPAK